MDLEICLSQVQLFHLHMLYLRSQEFLQCFPPHITLLIGVHFGHIALPQAIHRNRHILSKTFISNLPNRIRIRMKGKDKRLRHRHPMQSLPFTSKNSLYPNVSSIPQPTMHQLSREKSKHTSSTFNFPGSIAASFFPTTACVPSKAANKSVAIVTPQLTRRTNLPTSIRAKNRSILRSIFSLYPGTGLWMSASRRPSFSRVLNPDGKQAA